VELLNEDPACSGIDVRMITCDRETDSVAYRALTRTETLVVAQPGPYNKSLILNGGARRNRTDDLFNAIEALSQLSYGPDLQKCRGGFDWAKPRLLSGAAV
jgi:hypothetical protein